LEMAGAYATFANYGWQSEPTVIVRVTDSSGNVLLTIHPKPQLVLSLGQRHRLKCHAREY